MRVDVEAALREAAQLGLLNDGDLYAKSGLLEAFSDSGLDAELAESAFIGIRDCVKQGRRLGGLTVEGVGARRGRKYRFVGLSTSGSASGERAVFTPTTVPDREASPPRVSPIGEGAAELDIHYGDNLPILQALPPSSFDLIYIDPPFNTGKVQALTQIRTVHDPDGGDRTGFQGRRYRTEKVGTASFADAFDDFLEFMEPRLKEARRLLKPDGAFFLHIDYREVHYCKILLDQIFGRDSFINEIIWAYDYGGRSKSKWSAKHDNILWYAKNPKSYTFDFEEMDRIPYMAPGLVGKEKAARGKTPTDVWWHTIVPTNGKERTGYPTQKPLGVLNRLLKVHTEPGDRVLDFFAGSGTTGEAALRLGRSCVLVDSSPEAMKVMARRLSFARPEFHGWQAEAEIEADDLPTSADTEGTRAGSPAPSEASTTGAPQQQSLFAAGQTA